jgi:protein SCO1
MRKIYPNYVRVGATSVALILVVASLLGLVHLREQSRTWELPEIGGPFSLVDHHGKSVTDRDYLGKPTLVFFGFTHCPNVCPSTLLEITEQLRELGPDADRLNVLFITVDPERDTPEQLALYLSSFDPRITGLSGTPDNILAVEAAYHIYARKVATEDGEYTMDHTATIAVMNAKGQRVDSMHFQAPSATTRTKLHRLLGLKNS